MSKRHCSALLLFTDKQRQQLTFPPHSHICTPGRTSSISVACWVMRALSIAVCLGGLGMVEVLLPANEVSDEANELSLREQELSLGRWPARLFSTTWTEKIVALISRSGSMFARVLGTRYHVTVHIPQSKWGYAISGLCMSLELLVDQVDADRRSAN